MAFPGRVQPSTEPSPTAATNLKLPEIQARCSLIAGQIRPAKQGEHCCKEDVSPGVFGIQRTQGYIRAKNIAYNSKKLKEGVGVTLEGLYNVVFWSIFINYDQNVILQSHLEALLPDLPWYLLICQFLVVVEAKT